MRKKIVDAKPKEPEESITWVRRYRGSGLSVRQFALENGLKASQLDYWVYRKHAKGRITQKPPLFTEVKLSGNFANGPWAAEIQLTDGGTLRLSAGASPAWAGELLGSIRGLC